MLYSPEITVQPQTYREHHAFYHKHPQKGHVCSKVMKFVMCATPGTILLNPEWMDGTNSLWQFWHITGDYKLNWIHSRCLVWMKISIFWMCSFEPRPARGFFLLKGSLSFCWGQVLGFCKALRDYLNCNKYKQRWIKLSFKTELFSIRLHKLTQLVSCDRMILKPRLPDIKPNLKDLTQARALHVSLG